MKLKSAAFALMFALFGAVMATVEVRAADYPRGVKDGYGNVSRATGFATAGDFKGGEDFVANLRQRKRDALTLEERQSEDMAEFALFRSQKEKRERCIALLRKVRAAGPQTLWGWAALGFLVDFGAEKEPTPGGSRSVATASLTAGTKADAQERVPPKGTGTKAVFPFKPQTIHQRRLLRIAGTNTLARIVAANEGRRLFLRLWNDEEKVLRDFMLSGPVFNPPAAVENLLAIWRADRDGWTRQDPGRRIALAAALNTDKETARHLVDVVAVYRELADGKKLEPCAYNYDVREWRHVIRHPHDAEDIRFLASVPYPASRPGRLIVNVPYRMRNCFGDHIHGKGAPYYRPWRYCPWPTRYKWTRIGGVCTQQSMFAALCANAHGVMAFRAGQPRHCAWVRRNDDGVWKIHNYIKPYTAGVFGLWGGHFDEVEMAEHAFHDREAFRKAELYRFRADEARLAGNEAAVGDCLLEAVKFCPAHYLAWRELKEHLQRKQAAGGGVGDPALPRGATAKEWRELLEKFTKEFGPARTHAWVLANEILDELGKALAAEKQDPLPVLADAAEQMFKAMPQPQNAWIAEEMNWRKHALNRTLGRFGKRNDLRLKIVQTALSANLGRNPAFPAICGYALDTFAKDPQLTEQFLASFREAVGGGGAKGAGKVDWSAIILNAERSGLRTEFRELAELRDRMEPPKGGMTFKEEDFGGKLLSAEALPRAVDTCRADTPADHSRLTDLSALDAKRAHLLVAPARKDPWVSVELPGLADVAGVAVLPALNAKDVKPLQVSVSSDGKDWQPVGATKLVDGWLRLDLAANPPKVKFVKVEIPTGEEKAGIALRKFLVYGRPNY